MTFEVKKSDKEVIIEVTGRLDTVTAPSLDNFIKEEVRYDNHLVLDLKKLEYISSAGLRVLLSAQKKLQNDGSMKVINVCEEVMEVFEITGFVDILDIQ